MARGTPIALLRDSGLAPPVPHRISLQVTNRCDSRCQHCSIWQIYRDDPSKRQEELSADDWLTVIRKAVAAGTKSVDLTGGEPFLFPGYDTLVREVLESLGFACITTNAIRSERYLSRITTICQRVSRPSVLVVSVSIDGLGPHHDEIRGVPGGFDRAVALLRGLATLEPARVRVVPQVSFTITDLNVGDLVPLCNWLLDESLISEPDNFTFRAVQSGPYYKQTNSLTRIDDVETAILHLREAFRFSRTDAFILGIVPSLRDPKVLQFPCYSMFASCWIDPYGNVAPCVTMQDQVIGNLRDNSLDLSKIWLSAEAEAMRRSVRAGRCTVCWTDCESLESLEFEGGRRATGTSDA